MKKINTLIGVFLILNTLMLTKAQSPGGIAGAQLWYKGDAGIATAGSNVIGWSNSASTFYNLAQQGAGTTLPTSSQINFNPSVRFDGIDDRLATGSAIPQTVTTTASAPYTTSQYVVYRKLGSVMNPLYNHSDGSGGTWNVGSNSNGEMLVTNRKIITTAPALNETRLQSLNGTSNAATTYLNGSAISSTFINSTDTAGSARFWVGGEGTSINKFTNADIAEIVIYNTTQTAGRPQIESYLSLKYGITKSGNYVASNGTTNYWNAATNAGYLNNIAGIGKDDGSALYQKQSMSVNSGQQILIGLTGMANTNASNSGALTNQQFLVAGDNGLAKTPSVAINGIPGVNYRFGSVWKVQNTGSVGTVRVMWPQGLTNLKLVQNNSDPTFTTGNTATDMSANTQTINGVVYNYSDVSLADGQYFTLAAQIYAPGGVVNNLQVWNKADFGTNTTTESGPVTSWTNSAASGGQLQALSGFINHSASATYMNMGSNFNPAVRMVAGAGLGMLNAFSATATSSGTGGTFYSVSKAGAGGSPTVGYNVQMNVSAAPLNLSVISPYNFAEMGPYISNATTAGLFTWNTSIDRIIANLLNPSTNNILGWAYTTGVASTYPYKINGKSDIPASYTPPLFTGRNFHLNTDTDGGLERGGFDYQETIGYERQITSAEQNRIESYLAIKYGITLGTFTSPVDYTATNGTNVWSTAANSYQTNVIGIARDDIEGLHQRISKSQDLIADIITISTNNDFTSANKSTNHTDIVNDKFYFITGNNGAATTYNTQNMMNRIWKVQSTGFAQNLYIKTSDAQATHLIFADDAAMTTNVVNIPLTSGATPGIQIPNGKFFTFAKFSFCTKDPNTSPADTITKIGITIQTKQSGWPENIPNGAVALESKTKGFVITRTQSSLIANPVEGMLIYDTISKCMKLYNGTSWHCVVRSCN
ncbi:hypothetical protein ACM40_13070 [Chryseobacterium sp. BLS98]|uniref:hypothetical protein n=1 Tax=Chryseobacterium sp. BLS98 TaxID=885586 RepID=UPI00065A9C29|nr:hypothetical protein [Chryseobacterium sp. BLS98]KMQ60690.1 hypothetical protein ACM40_13070 [Chryseobacterium sp. BLS98]